MARKLENWIDSFSGLFEHSGTPELFRKWTAISVIAGVLERRIWTDVGYGPLYPNLYIILVAPPGIGKTELSSQAQQLLMSLSTGGDDGLHVSPSSMTSAAVIDALRDATRKIWTPASPLEPLIYNSLNIVSNELGTFLPSYDPEMMNRLTDIYDGHPYAERRRTKDLNFRIDRPQINFLAATTPAHLSNSLPEGAWDQGFLSRTLLIFNGERKLRPLFSQASQSDLLKKELKSDLKHIFGLAGEVKFSPEAADAINAWHMSGGQPLPDHPRLVNYNTRRTAHLVKLCMVASLAATDSLVIELSHYQTALDWLIDAESMMPDIFKALIVNGDMKAMDECWHFAYTIWMRENQPIAEHRLVAFLQEKVPVQNVMRMLQVMISAKILEEELIANVGKAYVPKKRR